MPRKKTEIVTDPTLEPAANDTLPPKPARASGGGWLKYLLVNLLVLAVVAAGIYVQRDHFYGVLRKHLTAETPQNSSELLAEIATLKSRLTAQEAAVQALANKTPEVAPVANPADAEKLSQLEAQTQALRDQLQQTLVAQQSLSQQVQQQASQTPPDLRLVALFQSLRAKALEGEAFEDSYQRFFAVAQPHPALTETLESLEVYASTGRPLLTDLQRSFQDSLKSYLKEKDGVNHSLSGKIKRNLADFITIRKLDDAGDSPLASINRAEKAVNAGRIERAVTELNDLPQDIAPFFLAWVEEAKGYYLIPKYIHKLDQRLAEVMMQDSPGATHVP